MRIVRGALKDYAWGRVDGLARWSGGATGGPQAEVWFGAHPDGPATVVAGPDEGASLADFPEHAGMPMLKVLAASTPLSLQVHPDLERAAEGFAADRHRDPAERRYADAAEKSEMLVALEPFAVHAGWRDPAQAADVLARAGAPADLVGIVAAGDPVRALRAILALPDDVCLPVERALVAAATAAGWSHDEVSTLARVAATHSGDPGVLVSVLLRHRVIEPGTGLAVPAGVIHSYVEGLGLEVMTSSDNVLRLGLTPKPIAVDDALAALRIDRAPTEVDPREPGDPWLRPAMPFALAIASGGVTLAGGAHRIALALDGPLRIRDGTAEATVPEGLAAVWAPDAAAVDVTSDGRLVAVSG